MAADSRPSAGVVPDGARWRRALFEWARSDGVTWVYIAKVLAAALGTLWLAMRLELPQPGTAVITVFIVMQPQSGMVFAKAFYRLLGSVVGLGVMLVLVALFVQQRTLFLVGASLWVGLCTAGAARYRDFRSYACLLAGYTATLIGLPAAQHPEAAFLQAVWRLLEVGLGIVCAATVSAVILPRSSAAAMRNAVYRRFGAFAAFVLDHLDGRGGRAAFEAANVAFAAQAVGLEALRCATAFEDPHMRQRGGRLARLNHDFMAMSTRYHALHQLLARLRGQGAGPVLRAFEPCLGELRRVLQPCRDRSLTDLDAIVLARRLDTHRQHLMHRIRAARAEWLALEGADPDAAGAARTDFDTAAELLYRLADDLYGYARTHASLAARHDPREREKTLFSVRTNALAALVAGARTALAMLVFSLFWIASAWPSGGTLVLNAAATAALASASPNPTRLVLQMAGGTLLAALLGFTETFFVFPHLDGFPLLALTLAPVFALGALLSTRPAWAGYGLGLLVFFSFGSVPANPTHYDPARVINEYIALVLSQLSIAAMTAVILPPASAWLWRRLARDLRLRVVHAVTAPVAGLAASFESGTRDLLNQAYGLAADRPDVQRRLLAWTFQVLEVGHAVIELRREQEALPEHACYADCAPRRRALDELGAALVDLFALPDAARYQNALAAVATAIERVRQTDEPHPPDFESSPPRRVLSYLHFIRSALLDPQAPLSVAVSGDNRHAVHTAA